MSRSSLTPRPAKTSSILDAILAESPTYSKPKPKATTMLLPSILTAILTKSQANKEKKTRANLNTNIPNLSNVDEIKEEPVSEPVLEPVLEQVSEPVSTQQYMNAVLMQNRRIRQQKQQQQQQILNTIAAVNQANAARPRNSNPFRQMKI